MFVRKKYFTFFCVIVILAAFTGSSWGFSRQPPEPAVVPGKVIVKFHEKVDPERIVDIIESEGGTIKSVLASTGVHIIILPGGMDVTDAMERFSSYPEVQYVEPVEKASLLEEK